MANSKQIGGYEIFELLGEGGMGAVFKARQTSLDRLVAIKILKPAMVESPADVARFQLEARAAAKLNHPGIVQVYDAGEEGGRYYFAMEFIEGHSLGDWLEREGKISENDALAVAACVSEALANAWSKAKITHRDIKPDNILLAADGMVKVADLGLVKMASLEDAGEGSHSEGVLTPNYCSPEQAGFLDNIDFRSDIYSLGATLYHMVTGKLPFGDKEPQEAVRQQVMGTLPDPRDLVPGLSDGIAILIRKMMAKKPGERYTNWEQVGLDIGLVTTRQHPADPLPEASLSTVKFKASKMPVVKHPAAGQKVVQKKSSSSPGRSRRVVVSKKELSNAGNKILAKKKKQSPVGIILGLLLVVGLAGGSYYYVQQQQNQGNLNGSGGTDGGGGTAPVGKALTMKLGEAKAFSEQHPEDYEGAITLYREAESLAAGTKYAAPVAAALKKLTQLRQQKVDGKLADLEAQAEQLVANREVEKARQLVLNYSGPYAEETYELRQVMIEEINARWQQVLAGDAQAREEARRQQKIREAEALLSPGLKAAHAAYEAAMVAVRDKHRDKLEQAHQRYKAMLEKVSDRARKTGDLDMVLEVKNEITRFEEQKTLPTRVEGSPSPLVKEVLTRGALLHLDMEAALNSGRASLVVEAVTALETEQRKLIGEDKLDQAIKIKEVLEHLKEKGEFPDLLPQAIREPAAGMRDNFRKPAHGNEAPASDLEALLKG